MSHRHWTRLLLSLLLLASSVGVAHAAPTLTIAQQGLERLTITWSGAPPDAEVVYGKAVVGAGASGSIDIPPAQIAPGRIAVLYWQGQTLAQVTTMGVAATLTPQGVVVTWSASEPVCPWLESGAVRLYAGGALPCRASGVALLGYVPDSGARVVLRTAEGREVAGVDVGYRIRLPIVVKE